MCVVNPLVYQCCQFPPALRISVNETYVEVTHGIGQWPALVNVRALLLDGPSAGWYTDGQGNEKHIYMMRDFV